MAKKKGITSDVRNKVVSFARMINNQGFPITKLIIFGSYAKGRAVEGSDIDLCLVSSKFGRDPVSELQFLLKQSRNIDDRIEPIPVSAREYKEGISPLVYEIRRFGKEVFFK